MILNQNKLLIEMLRKVTYIPIKQYTLNWICNKILSNVGPAEIMQKIRCFKVMRIKVENYKVTAVYLF